MYKYIIFLNEIPNWSQIFENSYEFKESDRIKDLIHLKTCVFYKSNAGLTLLKPLKLLENVSKSEKTTTSVEIVQSTSF